MNKKRSGLHGVLLLQHHMYILHYFMYTHECVCTHTHTSMSHTCNVIILLYHINGYISHNSTFCSAHNAVDLFSLFFALEFRPRIECSCPSAPTTVSGTHALPECQDTTSTMEYSISSTLRYFEDSGGPGNSSWFRRKIHEKYLATLIPPPI